MRQRLLPRLGAMLLRALPVPLGAALLALRPTPAPAANPPLDLVPVIFANGEDDDVPGLVAAVRNQRVQLDDRIYAPGETITIAGRKMYWSRKLCFVAQGYSPPPEIVGHPHWVIAYEPLVARRLNITNNHIRLGVPQ